MTKIIDGPKVQGGLRSDTAQGSRRPDSRSDYPERDTGKEAEKFASCFEKQSSDDREANPKKDRFGKGRSGNRPLSQAELIMKSFSGVSKKAEERKPPSSAPEYDSSKSDNSSPEENRGMEPSSSESRPAVSMSGDAILQSFHERVDPESSAGGLSENYRSSLSEMIDQVADRILVSDKTLNEKQEVRIQLKDSVLQGTEIQIAKKNGKIVVQIVTTSEDSLRLLSENKNNLQNHLDERLSEPASLVIKRGESEAEGGDRDGRSRQQRNLYDEMTDE